MMMRNMLSTDTKSRLWMLWPFFAATVVLATLIGLVAYLLLGNEPAPVVDYDESMRERMKELSDVAAFRAAYIEANGGEQKLEQLRSVLSSGLFESGGTTVEFRTIKRRPDQSITTLKMPDYDLSFIVDGDLVWQRVEQPELEPVDTLKTGREAEAMRDMGYFFDPLMDAIINSPESIVSIIPNRWEGAYSLLLQLEMERRGIAARVYIDPVSLTPMARIEDFADGQQRKVIYNDYRAIDGGMREPFEVATYLNGEMQNRVTIERCIANPGILGKIFEYTGEQPDAANKADSTIREIEAEAIPQ